MYYQEYQVGKQYKLEPLVFTAEEIITFAKHFDARPFHLSDKGAEDTMFGSLVASGLHTLVRCWSQWTNTRIDEAGMICGIEVEWNKWVKPVYPGDSLDIVVRVSEKIPTHSSERGIVKFHLLAYNQRGELAMDSQISTFVKKAKTEA